MNASVVGGSGTALDEAVGVRPLDGEPDREDVGEGTYVRVVDPDLLVEGVETGLLESRGGAETVNEDVTVARGEGDAIALPVLAEVADVVPVLLWLEVDVPVTVAVSNVLCEGETDELPEADGESEAERVTADDALLDCERRDDGDTVVVADCVLVAVICADADKLCVSLVTALAVVTRVTHFVCETVTVAE